MKIFGSSFNNYFYNVDYKITLDKEDILIKDNETYQTLIGFGGAFTDSSGYLFNKLSLENKKKFIDLYYGKDELNYTMMRLTIGSCDFSVSDYDYITKFDGSDFSLKHDEVYIIPFVKKVKSIVPSLLVYASIWSAPAFYKTNNDKCHGGKLKEDCYSLEAKYFTNYILAMSKEGIEIEGISMQNEPMATQSWESCLFTPKEEVRLLKETHKSFKENNIKTKLYLWDHNRDEVFNRATEYFLNEEARNIASGLFYHWYDGNCSANLTKVHNQYPEKELIFSEGCIELLSLNKDDPSKALNTMANALRYARNYILDSNNFSNGFMDWNMLLNQNGGPNHVGNYCEAPILYNEETKELMIMPSYYVIKHFSKFIHRGAKRIGFINNTDLLLTSFINLDGEIIVVISNESKENRRVNIKIKNETFNFNINSESVVTIVY